MFLSMSNVTEEGVNEVKTEACKLLLAHRVETKMKGKKVRGPAVLYHMTWQCLLLLLLLRRLRCLHGGCRIHISLSFSATAVAGAPLTCLS